VFDARAVGDVEAIVVPPEALRTLLVAEAELGERILRALILRRVALIEIGFGGPVIIGALRSPDVTRAVALPRTQRHSLRVVDPDEGPDASRCSRGSPRSRGELPIVVLADGTVLRTRRNTSWRGRRGPGGDELRSEPYDVAIGRRGPGRAGHRRLRRVRGASPSWVLEAFVFGGQGRRQRAHRELPGFPTGVSGRP
jgi:thioredoxin reductase (NADPH)